MLAEPEARTDPANTTPAPGSAGVVLVVDDAPDTLRLLCDALADDGYTVLVAGDGHDALDRLELAVPDAILLDAVMPGLSGFEVCRRLKAQPSWAHVPVIFMTGLSETENIVDGFDAGGVDYVVKPIKVPEVLARLATHVRNAKATRLAREAVDVGGLGVVMLDARGRIAWHSPRAQGWLQDAFGEPGAGAAWLSAAQGDAPLRQPRPDGSQLVARQLGAAGLGESMWLLHTEAAGSAQDNRLATAALTPRETEVLSWLAKGKTNRDIGDILGMSPRTVNKHLEHIFEKLGVETRAAAAALASRTLG
ncbi:response regulator transcription factor [Aquabacterium sp. J223]|uniref:response regulator transcription factor n=1 Tax=Aquabacterium sp. J223 TaxID=2898431 RepID=UPI0021ADF8A2|nr:response regulator transcription factor [Aquabacterium sp. J223]UUX95618.1 response regulator transcription factor [Aquabacterium sp. J223]